MRKLICALSALALVTSASAQHAVNFRPWKANKVNSHPFAKSANKSAALFKPKYAKDYYNYDTVAEAWGDSLRISYSYYPNGKVLQELYEDFDQSPLYKINYTYDKNGMESKSVFEQWDGTTWNLVQESGTDPKFDNQGRLTSFTNYSLDANGDTAQYVSHGLVNYYNDSTVVRYYDETSSAPEKLIEKDVYSKFGGSSTYVNIDFLFWDEANSNYIPQQIRKTEYNGAFKIENFIFFPDEIRLYYKYLEYSYTYLGVDYEGRLKTTITPTKETELYETKTGLLYTPDQRYTYTIDSHGNVTLSETEYEYNALTQDYDNYYNEKHDFTYQGDNKTSDLASYKDLTVSDYQKGELLVYSDFADLNGIRSIDVIRTVTVSPNPSNQEFSFELNDKLEDVFMVDMCGRKVKVDFATIGSNVTVTTTGLEAGVYTLVIRAEKGNLVTTVAVAH